MIRTKIRQYLTTYFEDPVARILHRMKFTPNSITILGVVITFVSAYMATQGAFLLAGIILITAGLLDMLDGALARLTNKITLFGSALDSIADRISEAAILFGIFIFYMSKNDEIIGMIIFLTLVSSFMVSYIRAKGEALKIHMKDTGIGTRPERVLIITIGLISNTVLIALIIVLALSLLTCLQRLRHLWNNLSNA